MLLFNLCFYLIRFDIHSIILYIIEKEQDSQIQQVNKIKLQWITLSCSMVTALLLD